MKKSFLCVALAGSLIGCTIGPEYKHPDLDVPEAFRDQQATTNKESLADLAWQDMYQDNPLRQLLKTALAQNRDVKIAAFRIEEARAQLGVSGVARLPQINAAASGQRGRVFQGGEYVTGAIFSAEGQLSYEADLWRRLASINDVARANLLATEFARDAVRTSLVNDVATTYFNLISLDQQLRITERTIADRQRFLELTQSKFRYGAAAGLDVNRAEASLAAARANIPDLQRQIAQSENQLRILLGQNPGAITRAPLDLQALPQLPTIPAGLPSSLIERRPDLHQAEENLIAATANVRAVKAALFPTISLTGNLGVESFELSKLFDSGTRIWSFGLNLLQPLINAQRNGYQVEAAQARREQAILQYQNAVAQAFREVSDALVARNGYVEVVRNQEQQVKSLREVSARVLKRYQIGYSSYFEVIEANNSLFVAELQLVQAYRSGLVSQVQLYKALGGGWMQGTAEAVQSQH
ncbi:MAG: efflux transporter outer membrane subunit [Pseudomonadota bacterium]